ncbi:MAG TPA: ABC transporter substrate-binding protein, partial [Gammaproteobacteria bacterium]|nr:ABC transporter substrate-binding protein [Gammaproteobacteria bacterium]
DYNKDTDFYSGVSRVLAAKPDVLFIGGASEPTALVVKQARELGFKGGFIVMDQAKLDEMARVNGGLKLLEGAVGVMPLVYDVQRPGAQEYVKRFRALYGKDPSSEIAYNYFGAHVVIEAMKHAGTVTDARAIRANIGEALKTLPEHRNPIGYTDVDATGSFGGITPVGTVINGKVEPVLSPAATKQ